MVNLASIPYILLIIDKIFGFLELPYDSFSWLIDRGRCPLHWPPVVFPLLVFYTLLILLVSRLFQIRQTFHSVQVMNSDFCHILFLPQFQTPGLSVLIDCLQLDNTTWHLFHPWDLHNLWLLLFQPSCSKLLW